MQLPHTEDVEWRKTREVLWEMRLNQEYLLVSDEEMAKHRKFFFNGDLQAYLNEFELIRYSEVFRNFPAVTLDQFKKMTAVYWKHAHESENNLFLKVDGSTIDIRFYEAFRL